MNHCYVCNEPSVSDEHIPPQCLFPEAKDLPPGLNFRRNLITVPSCAEHNLKKSGDDEYLLFVLAANINANLVALRHWRTKVRRALRKRPTKKAIFKNLRPVQYQGINTGAYTIDLKRLSRQFDLITRGIYFYHFRKSWIYEVDIAFPFILSESPEAAQKHSQAMIELVKFVSDFLKDEPKQGENKEIFYYQYKLKVNSPGFVLKMVFYDGIEVVAVSEGRDEDNDEAA
jgi:hypothetical protein